MWPVRWAIRPLLRPGRPDGEFERPAAYQNIWSKRDRAPILPARGRTARAPSPAPAATRSRRSRPPSATGSGRASRLRPTPRPGAGPPSPRAEHTLIHAPTGSGKTLAAFLWCLDRLARDPRPAPTRETPGERPRPVRLAAQGADLRRRAQPAGAADRDRAGGGAARRARPADQRREPDRRHARRGPAPDRAAPAGHPHHDARVAVPDAHQRGARGAARVEHVIIDEVHAIAGTKRGAHLALSLERLEAPPRPAARTRGRCSGSACPPRNGRSRRSPGSSAASARTAR